MRLRSLNTRHVTGSVWTHGADVQNTDELDPSKFVSVNVRKQKLFVSVSGGKSGDLFHLFTVKSPFGFKDVS